MNRPSGKLISHKDGCVKIENRDVTLEEILLEALAILEIGVLNHGADKDILRGFNKPPMLALDVDHSGLVR